MFYYIAKFVIKFITKLIHNVMYELNINAYSYVLLFVLFINILFFITMLHICCKIIDKINVQNSQNSSKICENKSVLEKQIYGKEIVAQNSFVLFNNEIQNEINESNKLFNSNNLNRNKDKNK